MSPEEAIRRHFEKKGVTVYGSPRTVGDGLWHVAIGTEAGELLVVEVRVRSTVVDPKKCAACTFEAEWGTEECPHPVDARVHTCRS
jgi:hypothetical protein